MSSVQQLRSKRPPVNIRVQTNRAGELLAISMVLQSGLRTTLEYLAVLHGCKEGQWLDEIKGTLVNDASNLWSENLPIDEEVRALDRGGAIMQALIGALRH